MASSTIKAKSAISPEHKEKFDRQFGKKGRASIQVAVDIIAQDGTVTMSATYEWYVQKI